MLYRRASRVVAISHPVAADLIGAFNVSPVKCVVVNNPALAKVGSPEGQFSAPALEASEKIVIVLACRLVPQKRPLVAVDVAAELNARGREVELWVFGAGPLAEDLRRAASASKVKLVEMGWTSAWFREVPAGAVHFLPSDQEGLGNVLVEAAGVGIRSVAYSGALGVADAMVPGITGALVAEPIVRDFADAVESEARKGPCDATEWLKTFSEESSGVAIQSVLAQAAKDGGNMMSLGQPQ
jgi:glycosyltransferase involved in cell wall biosynthesis